MRKPRDKIKADPQSWDYAISYKNVMALRSAYYCGVRNTETRQACRLYGEWRRKVRAQEVCA